MFNDSRFQDFQEKVNVRLNQLLPAEDIEPYLLHQAMRYSCLASGKRLRPILCMASAEAISKDPHIALDAACAIEMVHCFSLIHDDLPALDNDDLRRGMPTCHKIYGEAIGLLAGDALFAQAFQVLASAHINPNITSAAVLSLAKASSSLGLVGGEVMDILSEGKEPNLTLLELIHHKKTGSLFSASCVIGGIFAGATTNQLKHLENYGSQLGLAFQIIDDILNETSTPEKLGKAIGSDREKDKATYPSLMGIDKAKEAGVQAIEEAKSALKNLPGNVIWLKKLADFSLFRES